MKLKIFAGFLIVFLATSFSSCRKHHKKGTTTYQTIDITLDENKSYQYNFGTEQKGLSITQQSKSFLVSEIDQINEASFFKYMPSLNFVGSDEVQVTMKSGDNDGDDDHHDGEEHHGNCQNHEHHNCNNSGHHDCDAHNKTIYTFKFTVNKVTAATRSTAVINEN